MSQNQTHVRVVLKNSVFANGVKLEPNTLLLFAELPEGVQAAHVTDALNRGNCRAYGARVPGAVSPVVTREITPRESSDYVEPIEVLTVAEPINRMKKSELQGVADHLRLDIEGTVPELLDRIIEMLDLHRETTGEDLVVMVDSIQAP